MVAEIQRRTILAGAIVGLQACAAPNSLRSIEPDDSNWQKGTSWLADLIEARFEPNDFNILDYGAIVNTDASNEITAAIAACHFSGGGRVVIPAGQFMTGPIHLLSNVNLHLAKGAILSFSQDPDRYLPAVKTRWEGMEMMGYSPLIYAHKKFNVAVTGEGVLDGRADNSHWWPWKGEKGWEREGFGSQLDARSKLMEDVAAGLPVVKRIYAKESFLRPSFIQFYECQQVKVEGITVRNAPFWLVHPVLSEHVIVRGVRLESLGPNSDGCNPESCRYVLIEDCTFNTGDDCIALKSGRNRDGRDIGVPCQDVLIRHCQMHAGHGGIVIGSEISGGARNIFVEHCKMDSPDLERGIRIKTNSVRGGLVENLHVRHITIGHVGDGIVINFHYEEGDDGHFPPTVRNIYISDLICGKAENALVLRGFAHIPIGLIVLNDVHFMNTNSVGAIEYADDIIFNNVTVNGASIK